ncbi:hypothetical protein [Breoghania sp.]|uniref:hypothetical protein n=1 Tax=Breoghania sp. TaxID=2065378 RepID=UPI00261B4C97|nr:hypothetical protein [Breoghania sp.]MDJ0932285.1 hypothetical protein [Breoghania sp.]
MPPPEPREATEEVGHDDRQDAGVDVPMIGPLNVLQDELGRLAVRKLKRHLEQGVLTISRWIETVFRSQPLSFCAVTVHITQDHG